MNEDSIWYQLWAPLAMYMNPIFSINVGKIRQDSWFYFNKQVSFWMRDDSLWANGAEVWLYISGSFWCHQLQLEHSLSTRQIFVVHGGLPMDPIVTLQDINAVDRPCKTMAKIPKIIILGHGEEDSRQISPIQNVNSLLSAAGAAPSFFFWEDPAKCMTRIWVLTRLALGEPSLQLATSHSQTNPPSMKKVTFHTGAPGTGATMFPSRTVHWWGAFRGQVLRDFRCRSCFLLEFNIDLVTPVSLWRHCHLPSAQFQTTHFLVRLAVNRARRTLS